MPGDVLSLLIESSLRASLMLAAAWVVTIAARRASASTRHYIWACAMTGAALVPIAASVSPRWPVPAPAIVESLSRTVGPLTGRTGPPALMAGTLEQGFTVKPVPNAARMRPLPETHAVREDAPANHAALAATMVVVWALGTVACLLYLAVGRLAAWRIRRSARLLDAPWAGEARALAAGLGIAGPIAFVESPAAPTPMVCGVWRPSILMPREAADWPVERLRVVLLHELAHIKRRDCLTQLLAQMACAASWYNPLFWMAARRLRAERERACDDVVLAAGTKGSDYARHLLHIVQATTPQSWRLASAGLAIAHRSQLERRLLAILDPTIRRTSAFSGRVAAVAAVALMSMPVAAVKLQIPTAPTPPIHPTSQPGPRPLSHGSLSDRFPGVAPDAGHPATETFAAARAIVTPRAPRSDTVLTAAPAGLDVDVEEQSAPREVAGRPSPGAQAPATPRTYLLIVDELHVELRHTPHLRELVRRLLHTWTDDGHLCTLVSTGTWSPFVAPTADPTAFDSRVARLVGARLAASEIATWRDRPNVELEMRHRATIASETGTTAVNSVATAQGGTRFTVVYVSSGYDIGAIEEPIELRQAAARANAAFYTVDLRGLVDLATGQAARRADWNAHVAAVQEALRELAR